MARVRERSYPPSVWGGGGAPVVHANGADAGIPGSWLPQGATPPASVPDLQGGVPLDVEANPTTAWTAGQYVQTGTAGVAGRATWTGTGWVGGVAPGTTDTPPDDDGEPCPPDDEPAPAGKGGNGKRRPAR